MTGALHPISSTSIMVDHIIASVAEEASGPSYTVPSLCRALAERGTCDVSLRSVGERAFQTTYQGWRHECHLQTWRSVPLLRTLRLSQELQRSLWLSRANVFHGHGLWLMPNIYPSLAAARVGKPFIVSPRGMLGEAALNFSRAKKAMMWSLMQRRTLQKVTCFHATSEAEYDDIRRKGLRQPIAIIPNGIDIPELGNKKNRFDPVVTYIGRVHPKKNIEMLLRAWGQIEANSSEWRLQIIGPDENDYLSTLKKLALKLDLKRVVFRDPIYNEEKTLEYQNSELFVLPTLNENFGMVVAEALANSVPVVCTKGAPWAGLESERCGWWVATDTSSLAQGLMAAIQTTPQERDAMGARGRAWMTRDFAWQPIAADMEALYRWQCGSSDRPACVHMT